MKKALLSTIMIVGMVVTPVTMAQAIPTDSSPTLTKTSVETIPMQETGVIIDKTGHLSQYDVNQLNAVAKNMWDQYDMALAVEFTDEYNGDIGDYAVNRASELGLGDAVKNNGLLFVINLNDREYFVATGDGISTIVTDAKVSAFNEQYLVPAFRSGDYVSGVTQVAKAISEQYFAVAGLTPEEREAQAASAEANQRILAYAKNQYLIEQAEAKQAVLNTLGKVVGIAVIIVILAFGIMLAKKAIDKKAEAAKQAIIDKERKHELSNLAKFIENFEFAGRTKEFKAAKNAKVRLNMLIMNTGLSEEQLLKKHDHSENYYDEIMKKLSNGIKVSSSDSIDEAVEKHEKAEEEREQRAIEEQKSIQTSQNFWNDLPESSRNEFRGLCSQRERKSWLTGRGFNSNLLYTYLMFNVLNANNVGQNKSIAGYELEQEHKRQEASRKARVERENREAKVRSDTFNSSFTSTNFGSGSSFGGGSFGGGSSGSRGGAGGSW